MKNAWHLTVFLVMLALYIPLFFGAWFLDDLVPITKPV